MPTKAAAAGRKKAEGGKGKAPRGSAADAGGAAAGAVAGAADMKDLQAVQDLLNREQELRRYYQLERDKVQQFYQVTQKELDNVRHALLNIDYSIEEQERQHQVEVKVYQQKIRHLIYEKKLRLQKIKTDSDRELQSSVDAHRRTVEELLREKQLRYKANISATDAHETAVSEARDSHAYMVNVTKKQNHQKDLARLEATYEAKVAALREDLELRRCAEVHEVEERKNEHINELIRLHEKQFQETKSYYNQITMNNLEIIKSLKDEIANMKKNDEHNETLLYDIERENSNLREPLQAAKQRVAELQQQLKLFEKDKQSLRAGRSQLQSLEKRLAVIERENTQLKQLYDEVHADREKLKENFEGALRQAMEVMNERNVVLQQSLVEASASVEERDAQLQSLLQVVNVERPVMDELLQNIDRVLAEKSQKAHDLQFELAKLSRNHEAVLAEYERTCQSAGIAVLALQ